MTEEARREWLAVAWDTLGHLPADILASGCRKAREQCDHPSKIVATVIAETKDWMARRREIARHDEPPKQIEKPPEDPLTPEERDEMNRIMKRFRLKTRYFDNGDVRELQPGEADPLQAE